MEGQSLQISKGPAAAHSYYIENNALNVVN